MKEEKVQLIKISLESYRFSSLRKKENSKMPNRHFYEETAISEGFRKQFKMKEERAC